MRLSCACSRSATSFLGYCSRADGQVLSIGGLCLGVAAVLLVFDGMNIVYGEALRAAGDNHWPLLEGSALSLVVFLGGGRAAALWLPGAGSGSVRLADGAYLCALEFAVGRAGTRGPGWRSSSCTARALNWFDALGPESEGGPRTVSEGGVRRAPGPSPTPMNTAERR